MDTFKYKYAYALYRSKVTTLKVAVYVLCSTYFGLTYTHSDAFVSNTFEYY